MTMLSVSSLISSDTVRQQLKTKDEAKRAPETREPDWDWLSSLLHPSPHSNASPLDGLAEEEDLEYFPGNDMLPDGATGPIDIFAVIAETSKHICSRCSDSWQYRPIYCCLW